jgi:DNA-binding IclR family transcriptional regulator
MTMELPVNASKTIAPAPAGKDLEPKEKDRQFVTALSRGLQILQCFTRSQPVLRAAEIARMIDLPQPTVWRLCYTLIQDGYLVHVEGSDKLRPNFPVLSLGFAAIANMPLAELARPAMQELAARYQGAVSLGVRDGTHMIYLERCQGSAIVMRDLEIGSRVPLISSVTGWGYIAGRNKAARERMFEEIGGFNEPRWAEILPKLRLALDDYDRTGYVVSKGLMHPEINAVGVPIASADGKVTMAMSSGGISQIFNDEKLAALGNELKQLAARLGPAIKTAG